MIKLNLQRFSSLGLIVSCLVSMLAMGWIVSTVAFASLMTATSAVAAPLFDDDQAPVIPRDELPKKLSIKKIPPGFDKLPVAPTNNPTTAAKNGTVSCASCHQPKHGFASPDAVSIGIGGQKGTRNAPTIINRGYGKHFSWDGSDFAAVFSKSDNETGEQFVTLENITKAIACFERTLTSGNSQVDRFRNDEYEALSKDARQGLWIFESRGGCWRCHNGSNLADDKFHNTGVGFGKQNRDLGRAEATEKAQHNFQFKTPTLRDIERTAPYMHDGSIKTLKEVIEFYNKGGAPDDPTIDKDMKPLKLTDEEVGFLVEFLKALSSQTSE